MNEMNKINQEIVFLIIFLLPLLIISFFLRVMFLFLSSQTNNRLYDKVLITTVSHWLTITQRAHVGDITMLLEHSSFLFSSHSGIQYFPNS